MAFKGGGSLIEGGLSSGVSCPTTNLFDGYFTVALFHSENHVPVSPRDNNLYISIATFKGDELQVRAEGKYDQSPLLSSTPQINQLLTEAGENNLLLMTQPPHTGRYPRPEG